MPPPQPIVRLIVMNNVFKLPPEKTIEMVELYDLKVSSHSSNVTCGCPFVHTHTHHPSINQWSTTTFAGLAAHALRGAGGAGAGQGLSAQGPQLLQPPRGHRQVGGWVGRLMRRPPRIASHRIASHRIASHRRRAISTIGPLSPTFSLFDTHHPAATATPSSPWRAPAGAFTWGRSARSSCWPTSSPTSSGSARCVLLVLLLFYLRGEEGGGVN